MSKLINYELKRVQITCPNCKHEFPYNKKALETRIKQLGQAKYKITLELKKCNENSENNNKRKRLLNEMFNYEERINDYNLLNSTLKENEDLTVFNNLKLAIKEIYGDEAYKLCMDKALRESNAYTTEKNMRNWY